MPVAWPMPPMPDDAQGLALQAAAEEEEHAPLPRLAGADDAFALAESASRHEEEAERDVGGRLGEHAGRVRRDDTALAARRDVDVVVADGDVRDDLELGAGGVEELAVDRSVSRLRMASAPATRRRSSSGLIDSGPGQASTSCSRRSFSMAASGTRPVTTIRLMRRSIHSFRRPRPSRMSATSMPE